MCVCVTYPENSLPTDPCRLPISDPTTEKKLSEKQFWSCGRTKVSTVRTWTQNGWGRVEKERKKGRRKEGKGRLREVGGKVGGELGVKKDGFKMKDE